MVQLRRTLLLLVGAFLFILLHLPLSSSSSSLPRSNHISSGYTNCGFIMSIVTTNNGPSNRNNSANNNNEKNSIVDNDDDPLSAIYQSISTQAIANAYENPPWPDSKQLLKKLPKNSQTGYYEIPSFHDGNAPLGLVAIVDRNNDGRTIVEKCDTIFTSFCNDLAIELGLPSSLPNHCIWPTKKGKHHITITIFHEHPSLLQDDNNMLNNWRHVTEEEAIQLCLQLQKECKEKQLLAPTLTLDSLLLTKDGAMIAGFIDTTKTNGSSNNNDDDEIIIEKETIIKPFQKLRMTSINVAKSFLGGELTSRPKNLIHVTIGRVLHLPTYNQNDEQEQKNNESTTTTSTTTRTDTNRKIANLIKEYNENILPKIIESWKNEKDSINDLSFCLTEITMLRDTVWTLQEYKEYGSWNLLSKSR